MTNIKNRPFALFKDATAEGPLGDDYITKDVEFEIGEYQDGESGAEIALCVLAAINVGRIKKLSELESTCMHIVESLDYVIELQEYPVPAAEKMLKRRSIGVGMTNLAYYLAKKRVSYEDKAAFEYVDELAEHIQYYLIKASVELAKIKGPCEWFHKTKYSKGIMPLDRANKNAIGLTEREPVLDWDGLREEVLEHGMRNSVLSCIQPCESSSVISNSTNGIEPIRALVTAKKSKSSLIKQVVESPSLPYTHGYEMYDNKGMLSIVAIIQKWFDQAISANTYINPYNPIKYESPDKIDLSEVVDDIIFAYLHGAKSLYYNNLNDGKADGDAEESGCAGGGCTL